MKSFWSKFGYRAIKDFLMRHKIVSLILLAIIIFVGYKLYVYYTDTSAETHYLISAVEKGIILQTVSGTGQVSASNQLAMTSKVSGDLLYLGVTSGQKVSAGTLIAQIEAQDAEANLENAKIALAKLIEPADKLSLIQAENALALAIDSRNQNYNSSFNSMDAVFGDLPIIMTGLDTLLNNYNASTYFTSNESSLSDTARSYRQTALASYYRAKTAYDKNLVDYRGVDRTATVSTVQALVVETAQTAKLVAQALKETNTAISYIINQTDSQDKTTEMTTDTANINTWTTEMNSHVTSLNLVADTLSSSARTIADKQESLIKLQEGADDLDIRSQELVVEQKQNALNDYYLRAPFDGTVAKLNIKKNDSINSGSAIATLITDNKLADISLNEVDVSKIKIGQKVTLTFDAIDSLSISGLVSSVDQVGTVSSGVVNYNIQISFDTQDVRVMPGMSVNASIATDVKQDVLVVPSSAVKMSGSDSYVEMLDQSIGVTNNNQGIVSTVGPTSQIVVVGLSDDASTEIVSGLKEGDKIITRTITSSASKTTTASAPGLFGSGTRAGGR